MADLKRYARAYNATPFKDYIKQRLPVAHASKLRY